MIGIEDLPTPEPSLTGWPWTEAVTERTYPGNENWPRISIVTPSLNQGRFLERTIRSVLLQGYPNLEYIIIDGGSTDGSVAIIEEYAPHLAFYVSERDRGYVHAINKGFQIATGEIMCWLSSDDYYLPGTLTTIAERLGPQTGHFATVGHVLKEYVDGRAPLKLVGQYTSRRRLLQYWLGYQMHQPAIFWRREVFDAVGYLDESRDLIADFDYWVRIARQFEFENVDEVLACATYHSNAKTGDDYQRYHEQLRSQGRRYWGSLFLPDYWILRASMFNSHALKPFLRRGSKSVQFRFHALKDRLKPQRIKERNVG